MKHAAGRHRPTHLRHKQSMASAMDSAPHHQLSREEPVSRQSRYRMLFVALITTACSPAQGSVPSETTTTQPAALVTTTSATQPSWTTAPPATALAEPTTVSPGEPWILYQSYGTGDKVFLVRPDGTGVHSPTGDVTGYNQTNPDWSPDGQRIVFAVNDQHGTGDLWTVNVDGTGAGVALDCVDPCLSFDDPAWSPNGTRIAYSRMVDDGSGRSTLEVLNLDTGEVEVILKAEPTDFYAGSRWSPEGNSIVLEVVHRTGPSVDAEVTGVTLSIVDLTSTPPSVRALTEPDLFAETADWSPDGQLIVFAALCRPGDETEDLFIVHPDGSGLTRITNLVESGGNATHPSFTADSQHVIFAARFDGRSDNALAMVDLEGGEPVPATATGYRSGVHPRMRPLP